LGFLTNWVVVTALVAGVCGLGYGWELVAIYFIPQRIGMGILAWWFDWLPHHDLAVTAKIDRFRASRVRVGWESVMNLLLFYQNYHVVHHIHAGIPFYLYVKAWKQTEADYLDRNVPINTAWGRELTPSEYRAWREITSRYDLERAAEQDRRKRSRFHSLRIAEIRRLTAKSVLITFDVPDELAALYRFRPGQHIVVRTSIDGHELRRNYSICSAAGSGVLRIAVKQIDPGWFSRYANTMLREGDELEVMPPSGHFVLTPAEGRTIGLIAAGSGITPIISILSSALAAEPHTRVMLLYANHDRGSVMFAVELTMLARQFDGRLHITHYLSDWNESDLTVHCATAEPTYEQVEAGRLTADRLAWHLEPGGGGLAAVDEWYICGPQQLIRAANDTLLAHRVPGDRIHRELFVSTNCTGFAADAGVVPVAVIVTLDETTTKIATEGDESLLDAALRAGINAPYSCVGGKCGTCKAKLLSGTVYMEQNYALSEADIADGWILTCQSRPTADTIHVLYKRGHGSRTNSHAAPRNSTSLLSSNKSEVLRRRREIDSCGKLQVVRICLQGVAECRRLRRLVPRVASLLPTGLVAEQLERGRDQRRVVRRV
jgi:ferredoxin-NADP reductase